MTGYSLHIGLNYVDPNAYNGWNGALSGCINDANSMQQLANTAGFTTVQLIDSEAGSRTVIGELGRLARTAIAGDICLVTYSGHGGQVDDSNGDELDWQDETWVLWDRQVIDDELYQMWSQFATGVRILVISDSCHSGTVARQVLCTDARDSLSAKPRSMSDTEPAVELATTPKNLPIDVQRHDNEQRQGTYEFVQALSGPKSDADIAAELILISGCQDNQLSYDGAVNGQFTGTLLQVWANSAFHGDYVQFHRQILDRMPPDQSPNLFTVGTVSTHFMEQRPFTIQVPAAGGTGTGGTGTGGTGTGGTGTGGTGTGGTGTGGTGTGGTGTGGTGTGGTGTGGTGTGGTGTGGTGTGATGRPTIRRGDTGEHVTYLQERLWTNGYVLTTDGIFGPGTESVVRSFQRSNSLVADGVVGGSTWAALG